MSLQQLDRQLVDDPQRLDELAELLGREPRVGLGVLLRRSSADAFRIVLSSGSSACRLRSARASSTRTRP